jgi:peptidoglycan/xylan/chitin deacetylase (PgdA/CDA1 family)
MSLDISNGNAPTTRGAKRSLVSLKEKVRVLTATALHRTGLMRCVERLSDTHELRFAPESRVPALRRRTVPKFAILGYHRVGTKGIPLFSRLDPSEFEAQMRYLKKHYRVVPLEQLCRELREAQPVKPTIAVTFDDGYRDLYTYAFPVLQKYQIPATVYLIGRCMETGEVPWYDRIFLALKTAPGETLDVHLDATFRFKFQSAQDRVGAAWEIICYLRSIPDDRRRAWCAGFEKEIQLPEAELEGRMLNWDQVRALHQGGISFGAHTMSHPAVSQLEPSAFDMELRQSRRLLEEALGAPMPDFAYPFGKTTDQSPAAEEFLARCGYRSAVTTIEGYNTPNSNPFGLRRLQIDDADSISSFAFMLGRLFLESSDMTPVHKSAEFQELAVGTEPTEGGA